MGTREEYTTCMKPYMSGGGPERKQRFCAGAKICSGKAADEKEAGQLCAIDAANPKPPKEPKTRGRKVCSIRDLEAISVCMSENIDLSQITDNNMSIIFGEALKKCSGAKTAKGKRISSAKQTLETMDPQHIKALETIAKLSKQSEGRPWGRV